MKHPAAIFLTTFSLTLLSPLGWAQGALVPPATTPTAAEAAAQPMPYYSAEQALQGVYAHQLPAQAQAFEQASDQLLSRTNAHCSGQATLTELRLQWQQTLVSWQALSSPELGPLVTRRSQREIDFWPTRERLLRQALAKAPQTLADMERVGTPAKGFPAFEQLLATASEPALAPATCHYAGLVAQGIAAEARSLDHEVTALVEKDWSESPEDAGSAFAEWINQWLGGLERLQWAHIEKPIQTHRTTGAPSSEPVAFPRLSREANLADWRAQWQSLLTMARLRPGQYAAPPLPGKALVPIEALLIGKGLGPLAQRWAQAIDRTSADLAALTPQAGETELLAMTQRMKAVTLLYQNEVAAALDVPLGFSSADGD
ncbi:imelysin family protein [Hydrogenophaga sp. PAMC20947]|uniref:imelysin family protein n=1 Tax=Hydrogenophaga sp. PAMC20947 TaxID=2565558 RepID=UPI00109D87A7|nr:imelysin family protein [Hydrogenophaga sp. PAMC20947]QCB47727.1 peptidase M75 [Hydrogenophaga sp. PAMC20947]